MSSKFELRACIPDRHSDRPSLRTSSGRSMAAAPSTFSRYPTELTPKPLDPIPTRVRQTCWRRLSQHWSELDQFLGELGREISQFGATLVTVGANLLNVGQFLARSRPFWCNVISGAIRTNFVEVGDAKAHTHFPQAQSRFPGQVKLPPPDSRVGGVLRGCKRLVFCGDLAAASMAEFERSPM